MPKQRKRDWGKHALALAAVIGALSFQAPAMAQASANTVSAVVNVNSTELNTNIPTIQANMSEDLLLDVNNNLAQPIFVEMPELNLRYMVNAGSDQTFFFDLARMPSGNVPFLIRDAGGNIISTGQIALTDYPGAETVAMDNIINYNTAYAAESKPAPVYQTQVQQQPRERNYVRGYW